MITLIIVDCQVDFISGSMAIRGSKEAVQIQNSYANEIEDLLMNYSKGLGCTAKVIKVL